MKEPAVRNITPPQLEPILKVGIILEEDKKKLVKIKAVGSPLTLKSPANSTDVPPSTELEIRQQGPAISIYSKGKMILSSDQKIDIVPAVKDSDVTFSTITAGRGFHWQKEVDLSFSGSFTFHPAPRGLVVVNEIPLEQYLCSVISSEMSPDCPIEFAKAQAIAARSWVLVFLGNKHEGLPYTICNDDCCQRYQGTTHIKPSSIKAISECRGQILVTKLGFVCAAYYSKSCGGQTDYPSKIFGLEASGVDPIADAPNKEMLPLDDEHQFKQFLSSAASNTAFCSEEAVDRNGLKKYLGSVDETASYFRWKHITNSTTLLENISSKFGVSNAKAIISLTFADRSVSGRFNKGTVTYVDHKGTQKDLMLKNQFEIRNFFHQKFLFSSAFTYHCNYKSDQTIESIEFDGAGWGHGVGLCQIGALGMSLKGYRGDEIALHYFPNCKLVKCYQ